MQTETISITGLAKFNRGTTPATRAKLDKLGIKPVQEVEMPSGRKFVLFDKVKAIKALEKSRQDRESRLEKQAKAAAKKQSKRLQSASAVQADPLAKEVQELRKMVAQLLEVVTKPTEATTEGR
jgi:hypothetical protein